MFGQRKREALRAAISFVKPIVDGLQKFRTSIPLSVWEDPYILGFIYGLMVFGAISIGLKEIQGEVLGNVIIKCFDDVFGRSWGPKLSRLALWYAEQQDAHFHSGINNAAKYTSMLSGSRQHSEDPDVIEAQEMSRKLSPHVGTVGAETLLLNNLLIKHITSKYSEE